MKILISIYLVCLLGLLSFALCTQRVEVRLPTNQVAEKLPIKYVVVLMMENRAFDHMLGFLKTLNPDIDGLNGDETNPIDPSDPSKGTATVSPDAPYITTVDPGHSITQTTFEIFGSTEADENPSPMNGFVSEYQKVGSTTPGDIMQCFNPETVPSISTLAMEFALFDKWHASIPGPTQPNRMYLMSCTSHGAGNNNDQAIAMGYPQKSIFKMLSEADVSYGSYYTDFPGSLIMRDMRTPEAIGNIKPIERFFEEAAQGRLPSFSFLEPAYFTFVEWPACDQHPPHDVVYGEYMMADVYEALRASPTWNETLLIITYDEHGGFYDHVPPPQDGIPNPDGIVCNDPYFTFQRLGVRVPTIMISPWINQGVVVHKPTNSQKPFLNSEFEHSSISSTLRRIFNISSPYLTKREEWSATFEDILLQRDSPREDCPTTIPRPGTSEQRSKWKKARMTRETAQTISEGMKKGLASQEPLTELQREFITMANGINGAKHDTSKLITETDGALFVRQMMKEWFENGGSF